MCLCSYLLCSGVTDHQAAFIESDVCNRRSMKSMFYFRNSSPTAACSNHRPSSVEFDCRQQPRITLGLHDCICSCVLQNSMKRDSPSTKRRIIKLDWPSYVGVPIQSLAMQLSLLGLLPYFQSASHSPTMKPIT